MLKTIWTAIKVIVLVFFLSVLHYVLPQHDVGRITSTEIIRTDFNGMNRLFYAQADSGASELTTRDLRLINAEIKKTWFLGFGQRESTKVMVYRNEDTGWIWPPYFKFDSSDLQAQAAAEMSNKQNTQWVVITHYGWRNKYLTIYPNAIGVRPVDGPDVTVIPWFNIFFFVFLLVAFGFARAVWAQFRQRTVDPLVRDAEDSWDSVSSNVNEKRGRIGRWLDTWKSKK
ncbi:DUF1523 family protein [Rhodalgimonas zhirmunskyi]|uniref:DUF1523 family protein n=1 Tax=Rhodalgimonas zhirmunskyi TaxID=2964767 RepID=A0AAJ1U5Q1_9RHOB|nr:DUF1523 family protein [Rhodoalgimonas zhirmunskyi]MDQ2094105.1 DUF1523 family protein [Rhodoalgimonas zhirmunskyi]